MKSNYIPCPDEITQTLGGMASLLFGRIWRFSCGEDGYCYASQETLAKEIGVTDRTVRKYLSLLLKNNYIVVHHGDKGKGYKPKSQWGFKSIFEPENEEPENNSEKPENFSKTDEEGNRKNFPTKKRIKSEDEKEDLTTSKFTRTTQQKYVQVLGMVCKMDSNMLFARLSRSAKKLFENGYTTEQIVKHYSKNGSWYKKDWRGQKGQPPTPEYIIATIAEYCEQPIDYEAEAARKAAEARAKMEAAKNG